MKRKILAIVTTIAFALNASAQWTIDSLNMPGIYPFSGATNNKVVFTNGSEWNVFDAVTNTHTWGTLSISRAMIQTVTFGGKIYFGGGKFGYFTDPQYTNIVDIYNATSDSWSTLKLSKKREAGGAGAAANKIVFAGGTGRQDISGPVYMYATADIFDATSGMRTTGKLSKARSNIAVGASGNKIVFAGGWYWDINYNVLTTNTVDIYDASTDVWTKAILSKNRENIAVAVVGNKIIFVGGIGNSGGPVTNTDIYDVSTDTWSTTTLPTARYAMKSVVVGASAYFAGGAFDPIENEIDIYNTSTSSWSTIYLPVSLSGFSMSVINDKIYFAGGYISSSSSYSDLVQIYNPASGSWTTEYLSTPRNNVSALSCINKGYFAGGYTAYGFPVPVGTNRMDIRSISSPIADFTADITTVTEGGTVNFTDQSTNNPTSWLWTFEGGTPSTSTIQNPSGIQYNTAGTYNVTLVAMNGEGSNTITKVGYITVNTAPCVTPTGLNSTDITMTGATLMWNAVDGATKYKVSWKISGNNAWTTTTTTATSKILTGLTPNTKYLWKAKTICGQGVSSAFSPNQQFITLAGKLQSSIPPAGISIYPNLISDQFIISISGEIQVQLPLTCTIYNIYGNVFKQFELTENQQPVNASELPAGNYLLRVMDRYNNHFVMKMIKQ